MPNGGYPLWFGIPITEHLLLRFQGRDLWLLERRDGRWEDVRQIPEEVVAAMLYHLAYWGMPNHGREFIAGGFDGMRIQPSYRNPGCLYDY